MGKTKGERVNRNKKMGKFIAIVTGGVLVAKALKGKKLPTFDKKK